MSAELIIWKEAVSNNNLQELGKCYELFKGCKILPVTKRQDKLAVLMFKNEKEQVSTVIMTGTVNRLFREQKLSLAQVLTLPVLLGNYKDTDEKVMWLSLPAQGWKDMVEGVEITNYEDLALL